MNQKIDIFSRLLDQAECILVGAGSGLSIDAGIDYCDPASFIEKYPAMVQYGFTTNAELMGLDPSFYPGLFWGYYLTHGNYMRFADPLRPVYRHLLDLVLPKKDCFIITTNVDALFIRNGFAEDRIYTPQGDYGLFQCKKPCSDQTWPSKPVIKELLPLVDPLTGKLPEQFVPSCPNCGGPVFYNVREGAWFVDAPYKKQSRAYIYWVKKNLTRQMLLIDIGTGFHTPVWIRWPFEKITLENPKNHLVRINTKDPDVPETIAGQTLCFPNRAIEVMAAVTAHLNQKRLKSFALKKRVQSL